MTSLSEGEIRLRDGRRLAYAEYGDPQGKPIFFFHGTPGSRLFHNPDTSIAASAGARIIAVDRPGFGRSDFKPGRTLLDWPNDVVQLADALNMERFAVMGYSGGGPYAAVCASAIPDRLTAAGLVSSMAPLDTPEIAKGMHGMLHVFFSIERHLPPLAHLSCRLMCSIWRSNPDLYFKSQLNGLYSTREAQNLLPMMKAMLTADLLEAVRDGTQGITRDLEILAQPWGFQLHVIPTDVFLWHGEDDTQAPLAMGKRLAAAIPYCRSTFFPGEGHWAIYSHWQEMLTALARAEATIRERPHTATVAAAQDIGSGSEMVVLPVSLDSEDSPADSVQGLQPARETPEIVPTEHIQGTTTIAKTVKGESKQASKKTAKRRTAANAETPFATPPEPAPVEPAAKPVSKKTAKARTVATADKPAAVAAKTEPASEAPEPVSKRTTARRTAAADDSPGKASSTPKPAPQKADAAVGKMVKRAATATPGEPKPSAGNAKGPPKKSAKLRAAAVEPPAAVIPEESSPEPESPEQVSTKSSSRRKRAKEAVLV